eukprot:707325-Pleurochrysis_carterae.AAC.1
MRHPSALLARVVVKVLGVAFTPTPKLHCNDEHNRVYMKAGVTLTLLFSCVGLGFERAVFTADVPCADARPACKSGRYRVASGAVSLVGRRAGAACCAAYISETAPRRGARANKKIQANVGM